MVLVSSFIGAKARYEIIPPIPPGSSVLIGRYSPRRHSRQEYEKQSAESRLPPELREAKKCSKAQRFFMFVLLAGLIILALIGIFGGAPTWTKYVASVFTGCLIDLVCQLKFGTPSNKEVAP